MSPANENVWKGRDDSAEQGDTRRLYQIVKSQLPQQLRGDPVLIGFCSDAGVRRNQGRVGAAAGPTAIRRQLASLPAHHLSVLWDAGDVVCNDDNLEQAQQELADKVSDILLADGKPVILGGGHEVAWGSFQGLAAYLDRREEATTPATDRILIINLDAHFDLRTSRPASSGTPFDQILQFCASRQQTVTYACLGVSRLGNTPALFEHARNSGVFHIEDIDMQERHLTQRLDDLDRLLGQADHVYLTIDLDVLPAAVAPGVSSPAPLGVPLSVVEAITQHVKGSGKLRLADMAEMNPNYDIDQHTARVAARLAWTLMAP